MKKKIQRKPVRFLAKKPIKEDTNKKGINLRDIVTILGSVAGLIVAILWLAGRSYVAGYFSEMNIPTYQINLSVWEYAEVSWQRLIYYFGEKLFLPMTFVAVITLSLIPISAILQRIFPSLKMLDGARSFDHQMRELWRNYGLVIGFSISVYLFYLFLLALVDINAIGKTVGREMVLKNSYLVDIYSTTSLPLEQGEILQNTSPTLIRYSNLHLLTYNNGKYYLFGELDPIICKPAKVYIVEESQATYFAIGSISPINNPCDETAVP